MRSIGGQNDVAAIEGQEMRCSRPHLLFSSPWPREQDANAFPTCRRFDRMRGTHRAARAEHPQAVVWRGDQSLQLSNRVSPCWDHQWVMTISSE